MSGRAFVDTNVIVYLFDSRTPAKRKRAGELLQALAEEAHAPVVSTQVLQEAYVAVTRKLGVDPGEALATLMMMDGATFTVQPVDAPLVWRGARRSVDDQVSFWDGLIVETAREAGCSRLYSEDFQAGRSFDGVTVTNPFV